ncbi:unnamed protein product [Caretta caretta]
MQSAYLPTQLPHGRSFCLSVSLSLYLTHTHTHTPGEPESHGLAQRKLLKCSALPPVPLPSGQPASKLLLDVHQSGGGLQNIKETTFHIRCFQPSSWTGIQ